MTVDRDVCEALAHQLDRHDPEAIQATYDRAAGESLRRYMLEHRHRIGHALSEREYLIAQVAHAYGFVDGIELGLGIADVAPSEDREASE